MRLPRVDFVNRTLKKAYENHDTEIQFKLFKNDRPSNIYGERVGKTYKDPITVLGYFETNPSTLKLQDLGWTKEAVSVLVRVPFILLLEKGLANPDGTFNLSTSDLLTTPNYKKDYQIFEIQAREPFRNGVPTFVWIGGKNFINGS